VRASNYTVILVALAALATPCAASKQSKLEPPDLERYLRWGAVRARPGLEVSNVGYDSNIFRATGDREPVSDFTATLSPKLDGLTLLGDRAFLTFLARLDYTLYLQNMDQNFLDRRGKARITLPMKNKRFGLFSNLKLDTIQERRVDQESVRLERSDRLLGFGVILNPGWRTQIELGYSLASINYTDPDFEGDLSSTARRLDREEYATNLEASYGFAGRTNALLNVLVKRINFDNTVVVDDRPLDRDTLERRLLGGFEFGEGGALTGTFVMGWDWIDSADPLLADLSELVGEGELAYKIDSRTRLILTAQRLPGFAVWDLNSYYLLSEAGLRGVRYINRLVGVELAAAQGRLTFPESTVDEGRSDDILRYEAGVRLRMFQNSMGRRVEYSLRLDRFHRESTVPQFDSSRTTFGFGAVLGF
jgi:hypothetical protein